MNNTPHYDWNDPVFKAIRTAKRLAKEHLQLASLQSDVIRVEVAETFTPLRIPVKYHVHYHLKSIVGIDDRLMPIYGDHHILELSVPQLYPLEACKIFMLTDLWHPNIKSEGKFKGRVCGNAEGFGLMYDLYQLVLRVGEILQYKNYHATHTFPFPEDSKVADWVTTVAERKKIVDKGKEIYVDDSPLVRVETKPAREDAEGDAALVQPVPAPTPPPVAVIEPQPLPVATAEPPPPVVQNVEPPLANTAPKIKITAIVRAPTDSPERKIVIKTKD